MSQSKCNFCVISEQTSLDYQRLAHRTTQTELAFFSEFRIDFKATSSLKTIKTAKPHPILIKNSRALSVQTETQLIAQPDPNSDSEP
jgi:hypothetical protein